MIRPAAALALLVAACAPAHAQERFETSAGPVTVETVGPELDGPWSFAFLPDFPETGAVLVTEIGGAVKLIENGRARTVTGTPPVRVSGQGGLLDLALSPDFDRTGLLFLSFSKPAPGGAANTAVARARLDRDAMRLVEVEEIFAMATDERGGRHFGSRIAVAPDGALFVTTGDRADRPSAQDAFGANGKVHRILPDGSIPPDNPFADGGAAAPTVWSLGHRNPQGAAIHPETGALWITEHGARGGDEVNRPEAALNYGWPVISYGRHYSGARIGEGTSKPGMEQPLHYWDPSIAPSGLAFGAGDMFPDWRGDLFAGALKFQRIERLEIDGDRVRPAEILFDRAFGRIRDVRFAPDGALWFLTDGPGGRLHRVSPAP